MDGLTRVDLVTVVLTDDHGRPRPALVIQSELFDDHPGVTLLPVTSTLVDAPLLRLAIEPDPDNGLRQRSKIMIDKIVTVRRERLGRRIGRLDPDVLLAVDRHPASFSASPNREAFAAAAASVRMTETHRAARQKSPPALRKGKLNTPT